MEPERYTKYLPVDLTNELALRLPWRELYESYIALPEYQRYDPNHYLWRTLYRRDLSTYPLPSGANYRDQYFWGRALLDSLDVSPDRPVGRSASRAEPWIPKALQNAVLTLTELGYDVPLRYLIPELLALPPAMFNRRWDVTNAAVDRGYITILNLLHPEPDQNTLTNILDRAVRRGKLELVEHFLPNYTPMVMNWLIIEAAKGGYSAILDRLMEHAERLGLSVKYQNVLTYACRSDNPELVATIIHQHLSQPLSPQQLKQLIEEVDHLSVLFYLVDYMISRSVIKDLEDIDPDITMRAALNDCNMEYVLYAQRLGGKARDTKTPALNCSDPTLHQWIVDNVPPEVYQHSVATIIENRPELVPLYMNTLPAKLYYKALDEMVEAAIKSPDEAVYREVLANPIIVNELNKKWSHLNYDTSQLSAERFNYLLGQLSRSTGLRLLAHLPFDQLASIPTHSYTPDELAEILIGHRVGLGSEDWPHVRAFALTIPPAQRDAALSALKAHQAWDPSVYREYVDVIARVFDGQL